MPVACERASGLNFVVFIASLEGSEIAFLLKGQTPVTRKAASMFESDIALFHAFLNRAEKSNLVMSLPGFFETKSCTVFLHSTLSGANTPLSRGWLRWVVWGGNVNSITPSAAAALIISGQQ